MDGDENCMKNFAKCLSALAFVLLLSIASFFIVCHGLQARISLHYVHSTITET